MRCIVRRYVTSEQRKSENTNITEDDINEVIPIHTPYMYLHWYLVSRLEEKYCSCILAEICLNMALIYIFV